MPSNAYTMEEPSSFARTSQSKFLLTVTCFSETQSGVDRGSYGCWAEFSSSSDFARLLWVFYCIDKFFRILKCPGKSSMSLIETIPSRRRTQNFHPSFI